MTPPPIPEPHDPSSPAGEAAPVPAAELRGSDDLSAQAPVLDMLSMPDLSDTYDEPTLVGLRQRQKLFEGRFELQQKLGTGGMGQVWRALDSQLGEEVALKFLPPFLQDDPIAVEELKAETKNGRKLSHTNIVKIHGLQTDEKANHVAVEMEFVDGHTLGQLRVQKPNLVFEVSELTPLMSQLVSALVYAHEDAELAHRDLKPANLMLTRDGRLKITDFGISRALADGAARATVVGRSAGTLCYMSPQQAGGAKASPSDDIYALASTLYDLLTGRPPFYTGNIGSQLNSVTPPSITERRKEFNVQSREAIPEHWERAIALCLAKTREARPQSMREVAALFGISLDAAPPRAQGTANNVPFDMVPAPPTRASQMTQGTSFAMSPPTRGSTPTVTITAAKDQLRPINDLAHEYATGTKPGAKPAPAKPNTPVQPGGSKLPVLISAIAFSLLLLAGGGLLVWNQFIAPRLKVLVATKPTDKPVPPSPDKEPTPAATTTVATTPSVVPTLPPVSQTPAPAPPTPPPTPALPTAAKLQALIDAAPAGKPVLLPAGTYKGQLKLTGGKSISATATGQVVIEGDDPNQPALIVDGQAGTSCSNISFRHIGGEVAATLRTELVKITGQASFDHCTFRDAIGDAVSIAGGGPVTLTDCEVKSARFCGVLAQGGAQVTLTNIKISDVGDNAIDLRHAGTRAEITKGQLAQFRHAGITLREGAYAQVKDLVIAHHPRDQVVPDELWGEAGITVIGDSSLNITGGEIHGNVLGIIAMTGGLCMATEVKAHNNREAGIWLEDANPKSTLSHCTASGNLSYGVGLKSSTAGPGPHVEDCTLSENAFGLYVEGNGFAPVVLRNQIRGNASTGIMLRGCAGEFKANTLKDNLVADIDKADVTPELRIE